MKTVDIAIIGTTRAGLRARALWPNKTVALVCLPESPETLLARHTAAVSGLPFAVEPEAISLRGPCVFIDRTTFQVGEETIRAKKILLMSGCRHRVPAIDGLSTTPHFFSTTAPTDTPPSCLIVGAGHAGVAMAQRARQAGAQVSVVAGAERLLPKEDLSISDFFINRMRNQGITVHQNGDVVAVKPLGDAQIEATLQSGLKRTTVTTHRLVIAAGLVPNTAQLGLERAGIYVHDDGAVVINDEMKTSQPCVWAAGAVTGTHLLSLESQQAEAAVTNMFSSMFNRTRFNDTSLPAVFPTQPPIARLGLTEKAARERHADTHAVLHETESGFIKLIGRRKSGELLGVHIVGNGASELILYFDLMMQAGHTIYDVSEERHFPAMTGGETAFTAISRWTN